MQNLRLLLEDEYEVSVAHTGKKRLWALEDTGKEIRKLF